ncbi:hypothetical protein EYF80_026853 [Liparis tanakae]|uniref:Uncharacterized protein n=1 Tax=Liparis tanakae TaxID=230148 RepID=A0A4Z2HB97_9TELE|nr:hypothetical protein EYF80_026853 [Liparis tanakae]
MRGEEGGRGGNGDVPAHHSCSLKLKNEGGRGGLWLTRVEGTNNRPGTASLNGALLHDKPLGPGPARSTTFLRVVVPEEHSLLLRPECSATFLLI